MDEDFSNTALSPTTPGTHNPHTPNLPEFLPSSDEDSDEEWRAREERVLESLSSENGDDDESYAISSGSEPEVEENEAMSELGGVE